LRKKLRRLLIFLSGVLAAERPTAPGRLGVGDSSPRAAEEKPEDEEGGEDDEGDSMPWLP